MKTLLICVAVFASPLPAQAQYDLPLTMAASSTTLGLSDTDVPKVEAKIKSQAKTYKRVPIYGGFFGRRIVGYRKVEVSSGKATKKTKSMRRSRSQRCTVFG